MLHLEQAVYTYLSMIVIRGATVTAEAIAAVASVASRGIRFLVFHSAFGGAIWGDLFSPIVLTSIVFVSVIVGCITM